MSRSGYSDDCSSWELVMWRGAVASAIRGKRGQQMLKELAAALDAMPNKELIADSLESQGKVCAIGSLGKKRNIDLDAIDPYDYESVARIFGVSRALVQEIANENDSGRWESPPERWTRMRRWVERNIKSNSELVT